jgi:beta-glucosidase
MKKSRLFGGLSVTFASVLTVAAFMSVLAYQREGDINLELNITATAGDVTSDTNYYPSHYDGIDALRKAEEQYMIQTEQEGSVLLKNKSNALPLGSGKKVTLFGNASVNPAYHGGSGGPSNTGINLRTALEAEGFQINATVYDKIAAQNVTRGNSNIGEADSSIYDANDFVGYKDAAIVTICRYGGEQNDMDVVDSFGVRELSLHDSEKAILEKVQAGGFSKIIVLLNTGYAMEGEWLDSYDIDAALWIGFPGQYGMEGVAKMLTGEGSPSGRLVDTYAANSLSSAAMQNFGDFKFADLPNNIYHNEYLTYAEDIYVGYKYYETRYADQVQNLHQANSTAGAYCSSSWDYAAEMTFPFGYGLSYSEFTDTVTSIHWDRSTHTVTAKVHVVNNSSAYTGKSKHTVELYVSSPWKEGMAEKSAIQLIGFGKTKLLAPGEEDDVTITVDDYLFATYDEKAENGADSSKKGCYVFDDGDYYFAVGENAHDALNNVLAKQDVTGLFDENGVAVSGDKDKAVIEHLAARDNTTYARSKTGEIVSNKFQDINYNHFVADKVTYLTRGDWTTFPKSYTDLTADADSTGTIRKHMTATSALYTKPSDAPDYRDFKFSTEVTTKFVQMKDVSYDDDASWNSFIDQLSVAELTQIPGEQMKNDAIVSVGYPANSSGDGPDGLQGGGILHPSETLAAATYNTELFDARGEFLAEDAHYNGFRMVYGGGANMHRTPYAGRNFEYYSEDPTMSYLAGRTQGIAMSRNGLIGAFKHFLANDQETNRHGVATFMTEQTLREVSARGFEGALSDGAALANMGSYNRLGVVPTSSSKALMTSLLREEWGFKGISITDSSKDAKSYIFTADALDAGTDLFNNDPDRATEVKSFLTRNRDGYLWQQSRKIAKHFFYAYSRSMLVNGLTADSTVTEFRPWWKNAIVAIDASLGGVSALALGGSIYFTLVERRKEHDAA